MHINLVDGERRLPTTADVAQAGGGTFSFAAVGTTAPADAASASAAAPIGGPHGGHPLLSRLADNFHFAHLSADGPAPLPGPCRHQLRPGPRRCLRLFRPEDRNSMRPISSMRCCTTRRRRVGSGLIYMTWSQRGTAWSLPLAGWSGHAPCLARMQAITSMRCPSARCWRVTWHSMSICTFDVTRPAHLDQLRPPAGTVVAPTTARVAFQ